MLLRLLLLILLPIGVFAQTAAGVADFKAKRFDQAYRKLIGPAQNGDPEAQLYIGMLRAGGYGGYRDMTEAFKWYQASASRNYGPAYAQLGMSYIMGIGTAKDYARARNVFETGMELGCAECYNNLAEMYTQGLGVPRDPARARQLRAQAANMGNKVAQRVVREQDLPGYDDLQAAYQANGARQYANARAYALRSAQAGNVAGMAFAAWLIVQGRGGPKDYSTAMSYASRSGQAGDTTGMFIVAQMYEFGWGVPVNKKAALQWYDSAASRGDSISRQCAANLRSPDYNPAVSRGGGGGSGSSTPLFQSTDQRCVANGGSYKWDTNLCIGPQGLMTNY